ncbi:acetolactate synthase small subunit [Alkaliphilus peptidifermentans]|uniref:Acetolactate synthase small subunit n=1 Tax=Alkaliphilus peptidifermentans DSM 18978 TaxID=1120976 RepID=A0A1G5JME0_9FIRM|nr:acetolactate synthase small subunit [Alkaliphilus peptidifermentans]SCY89060.1 acetolactate synthase, small subunit [Alkaliphilus peptidifermentans DSM 18978]
MEKYGLVMKIENHFGVLNRLSGLLGRKGYNIDSLSLNTTNNPEIYEMTIFFTGDKVVYNQMINLLNRIIDVTQINELPYGKTMSN